MKRKITVEQARQIEKRKANQVKVRNEVYDFCNNLKYGDVPLQATEITTETKSQIVKDLHNSAHWWIARSWIFLGDVYFNEYGEWVLAMTYLPTETEPINKCGIYIATNNGNVYYSKY